MPGPAEPGRAGHEPVVRGFVVDVVPLLRWPGNQVEVHIDEPLEGLATSAAEATAIDGVLVVESMADSLTVTGSLAVTWVGACRRCLEPAQGVVDIEVQEIYERVPVEGETFELTDDQVDLRPMIAELVLLALPLAPLCGDDCVGPAPEAFPARTVADDAEPAPDPRWAALDQLVFDDD